MNLKTIILEAIDTINEELGIEELKKIDESTPLFELLDSLGTLDLILELESRLEDETGSYVAVADENSMNKDNTPFQNIVTLQSFLEKRVQDESDKL